MADVREVTRTDVMSEIVKHAKIIGSLANELHINELSIELSTFNAPFQGTIQVTWRR
jgi:hypothetical protein